MTTITDPEVNAALARVERLRSEIAGMAPLDSEQSGRARQRLWLEWTYHSNAIEGNSLTYGETVALLMHGVTAQGKPLKDHLDIEGHKEALEYLDALVKKEEPLILAYIRELHGLLLGEPYEMEAETAEGARVSRLITPGTFKKHPNHVVTQTGETHYYARPEEVEILMQTLVDDIRDASDDLVSGKANPVVFASEVHHRLVAIHPFDDGNGRMGRLLMNLILMRAGYVPAVIRKERRPAYYGALSTADSGDIGPLVSFVASELLETQEVYLRALQGKSDPSTISKRIALLKRAAEAAKSPLWSQEGRAIMGENIGRRMVESLRDMSQDLVGLVEEARVEIYINTTSQGQQDGGENAYSKMLEGDYADFDITMFFKSIKSNPDFESYVEFKIIVRDKAVEMKYGLRGTPVFDTMLDAMPDAADVDRVVLEVQGAVLDLIEMELSEAGGRAH